MYPLREDNKFYINGNNIFHPVEDTDLQNFFLELFIILIKRHFNVFKDKVVYLVSRRLIANTDYSARGMLCINFNFDAAAKLCDRTVSLSFKILHIHVRVNPTSSLQWHRQLISICAATRNELDARISFFFT